LSAPDATSVRKARRKGFFLAPAISLMNRLTYPRKFILISVLFLAALGLVMNFMIVEFRKSIDFTAKELEGTRYLRPMIALFRDAGEARRLARVYTRGDRTSRPDVVRKLADIDEDLKAVEAVDKELGETMKSTAKLATLKDNWGYLKKEGLRSPGRPRRQALRRLHERDPGLYALVGDESNLILDPDLDTYYLMDSILLKLHQGQDQLMKLALETEQIAFRKALSADDRAQLIVHLEAVRSNLQETRDNAERCFKNNPSGTARPKLQKLYDDFVIETRAWLDSLNQDLVESKTISVAPEAIAKAAGAPLKMSIDLWRAATGELDDLMRVRVGGYERRLQIAWICTAIALALVGYLWVAFYRAVMGTVDDLEHASQQMLGADPGQEIVLETHDELGRVTKSFNMIAQRLRREWEQATEDNNRRRAAEARLQESEERTAPDHPVGARRRHHHRPRGQGRRVEPASRRDFRLHAGRDDREGPSPASSSRPKYRRRTRPASSATSRPARAPSSTSASRSPRSARTRRNSPCELSIAPLSQAKAGRPSAPSCATSRSGSATRRSSGRRRSWRRRPAGPRASSWRT
jgi:hypothetical protein